MSEERREVPQEFYDVVDRFIDLANSLGQDWPRSRVSATIMFAAARYNAFNWLNRDVDLEQSVDQAVAFYGEQYEVMFRDNVEELTPVYVKVDESSENAT